MIIRLPRNFIYTTRDTNSYAYVENGILYVKGYINYEALMYNLAYKLKGYDRCCYCGELLTHNSRTMDHIYPRSWGGISLTNNLLPCCKNCNHTKSDMTPSQYKKFQKLNSVKAQHSFYQNCIRENEKIVQTGNFILPPDWITMYDASKLMQFISFNSLEKSKMKKLEEYYERYHQYPHPIIVSSNDWLFKGKHILYHAKKINTPVVPAIVLDNVVVLMKSS